MYIIPDGYNLNCLYCVQNICKILYKK